MQAPWVDQNDKLTPKVWLILKEATVMGCGSKTWQAVRHPVTGKADPLFGVAAHLTTACLIATVSSTSGLKGFDRLPIRRVMQAQVDRLACSKADHEKTANKIVSFLRGSFATPALQAAA